MDAKELDIIIERLKAEKDDQSKLMCRYLDAAISALEKQNPQEILSRYKGAGVDVGICPICRNITLCNHLYCHSCGQALCLPEPPEQEV